MKDTTHENETAQSLALVQEFIDTIHATPEGHWRCFETFFDDASIWENVGVGKTVGREAAIDFARSFPVQFDRLRFDDLVLSGAGDRVYAERLDHFCKNDGAIVLSVRALGVFEVKGRTITHYRDYFDTAGFTAALGKVGQTEGK